MHYHQGALVRNRWTCCQQTGKTSLGCQPTYHLLTRSSSRYAQMRRKDTLTSSQGSGGSQGRRSKSSSLRRGARASGTPEVAEVTVEGEGEAEGRGSRGGSGCRGLSNSCFDLTHKLVQNKFEPESPTVADSRRSSGSLLSTEPSISMGCITLTRLSLSESTDPVSRPLLSASCDPVARSEVTGQQRPPGVGGGDGGKGARRSRVQIAPETVPNGRPRTTFPSSESQPQLAFKATFSPLPSRFTHSASVHFAHPPSSHSHSHSHSSPHTSVVSPVAYHCMTEPRRNRLKTHPINTTITTNTAAASAATTPPSALQFSTSSMHHLVPVKPVLEPKVSVTDPNTIHV